MMHKRQLDPCDALPPPPQFMAEGWEKFLEMLSKEPRTTEQLAHLAFFAGGANLWGHIREFADAEQFDCEQGRYLTDSILDEINTYLTENRAHLE